MSSSEVRLWEGPLSLHYYIFSAWRNSDCELPLKDLDQFCASVRSGVLHTAYDRVMIFWDKTLILFPDQQETSGAVSTLAWLVWVLANIKKRTSFFIQSLPPWLAGQVFLGAVLMILQWSALPLVSPAHVISHLPAIGHRSGVGLMIVLCV